MLKKLWWGTYPLGVAFLSFYVFGLVLVLVAAGILSYESRFLHIHTVGVLLGLLVSWAYGIIASVGVWRSAAAGMASPIWLDRAWSILARSIVLILVARILWNLLNGGAHTLIEMATGPLDFD